MLSRQSLHFEFVLDARKAERRVWLYDANHCATGSTLNESQRKRQSIYVCFYEFEFSFVATTAL